MIVFDLRCNKDHVFEAWFASSDAFDDQTKAGAVSCPVCGSAKVAKALMAPAVAGTKKSDVAAEPLGAQQNSERATYMNALKGLRAHVEATCDNVGSRFPEEARKMHYGEAEKRSIYGEASERQAEALREEGIEFARIPWLPNHDA